MYIMKKIFLSIMVVMAAMAMTAAENNRVLPASSVKANVDATVNSDAIGSNKDYSYTGSVADGVKKPTTPVPPAEMNDLDVPDTNKTPRKVSLPPIVPAKKGTGKNAACSKAQAAAGCPKTGGTQVVCWIILGLGAFSVLLIGGTVYLVWSGVKKINDCTAHYVYERDKTVQNAIAVQADLDAAQEQIVQLKAELADAADREELLNQRYSKQLKNANELTEEVRRAAAAAQQEAQNSISQLESECNNLQNNVNTLSSNLQNCENALAAEKDTVAGFIALIGNNIYEMMEGLPQARNMQVIMLGLAKLQAMKDAGLDEHSLLKYFQFFDSQMSVIIKDVDTLQNLRENSKFVAFLTECMPGFEIVWPTVGKNTSEYNKELLDLGESASGTTIAQVKCAAISIRGDENPFQKAIIVCK